MTYPVSISKYPISTPYGAKGSRWVDGIHKGADQKCPTGTPVYAPVTGKVVAEGPKGWGPAFGRHQVIIEFRARRTPISPMRTYYVICAHMSAEKVALGQKVYAGKTRIGSVGASGNATGPHMHTEVHTTRWWNSKTHVNPSVAFKFPKAA